MKYKVGDKVKIRKDLILLATYGNATFHIGMGHLRGETVTICGMEEKESRYRINESSFTITDEMLEPIDTGTYKIFSNGPATICEKKDGTGKTLSKGIAKCCPDDHFNSDEGAVWALGRVVGFDLLEKVVKEHKEKEAAIKARQHKYKEGEFVIVTNPRSVYPAYVEFIKKNTLASKLF